MRKRQNKGFTLIEVLISLLIFSIGLLGLAMQLSRSLDATISKEVHSAVSQLVLQSVEPLNRAVDQSNQIFLNRLTDIGSNNTPAFSSNNSNKDNFKITVAEAIDQNNSSLFSTQPTNWLAPYRVVINVEYTPKDGDNSLNFKTTHVFSPYKVVK